MVASLIVPCVTVWTTQYQACRKSACMSLYTSCMQLSLDWARTASVATAAAIDCDGQRAIIGLLRDIASLDQLGSNRRTPLLGPDILQTQDKTLVVAETGTGMA